MCFRSLKYVINVSRTFWAGQSRLSLEFEAMTGELVIPRRLVDDGAELANEGLYRWMVAQVKNRGESTA